MDVYVRKWNEERIIKWLAVGMVLAMVGLMASQGIVEGQVVYYITHSEIMGAAAMGGTATIVAAGITTSGLTGLALVGAIVGGVAGMMVAGL